MFKRINSVYDVIGVMLFLILAYLVLARPKGVASLISNSSRGGVSLITALQARNRV